MVYYEVRVNVIKVEADPSTSQEIGDEIETGVLATMDDEKMAMEIFHTLFRSMTLQDILKEAMNH